MSKLPAMIGLVALVLIGLALRLHALSPYLFYPDSYTSLVVAHNLRAYGHVIGSMGPGGLSYPDFLGWTRPSYPLLIAAGSFVLSPITSSHVVNMLAGLVSIVLAYAFIVQVLRSRPAGLVAAGLLSISWGAVVWSGYVLTESLAVAMLLLALWQLWRQAGRPPEWAGPQDLLTGLYLALATLTRYEYAVVVIPCLIVSAKPWSLKRALNIMVAYALVMALGLVLLRPLAGGAGYALGQVAPFWPLLLAGLILGVLAWFGRRYMHAVTLVAMWLFVVAALALPHWFPAVRNYLWRDPLLAIGVVAGLTLMLRRQEHRRLGVFLAVCAGLLLAVYWRVNPTMYRYLTLLAPLFVAPAAYAVVIGAEKVWAAPGWWPVAGATVAAVALAGLQLALSWVGLRAEHRGIWFMPGYEQLSAQKLASTRLPANALIVASMPEPYFLFTGRPTQSISDDPPYLYLPASDMSKKIIIVEDQGMYKIFPHFSAVLNQKLSRQVVREYWVGTDFRYTTQIVPEAKRVRVYSVSFADLQSAGLVKVEN
jgi:4-amino-4-deoxy-L-arabinose transferase-like glycosyltransferase